MEETNTKYNLNLKFTKLEAPEVGLWPKTFQVAGHNEDQQLPKEQQSEPPIPQPHKQQVQQITQQPAQQMALLMSELQIAKQQVEINQMTGMATQWPCSTPVMSPVMQEDASGRAMPKWCRVYRCSRAMPYTILALPYLMHLPLQGRC